MNIVGNVRYQSTEQILEKALMNILKRKSYDSFSIKDICNEAGINRSSFYAHYQDINDFMIKVESKLAKQMQDLWSPATEYNREFFVRVFSFIKEHKVFYKAFMKNQSPSFTAPQMLKRQKTEFDKLAFAKGFGYADYELDYHLYFFGGGLKTVCTMWIERDCRETPEQMAKIIHDEYTNNAKY